MLRLIVIAIISLASFFAFFGVSFWLTGSNDLASWAATILGFIGTPIILLRMWPEANPSPQPGLQNSGIVYRIVNALLRMLLVRRAPTLGPGNEVAVLNYGLHLAQEWGEYWMQPIQARLRKAYPGLEQDELDRLNSVAQNSMRFAYDLVYTMAAKKVWPVVIDTSRKKNELQHITVQIK